MIKADVFATVGSGKTSTAIELLARRKRDEECFEWVDPTGETTTDHCGGPD